MATHEDGTLVVQLMRWGTEMGLEDALSAIFDEGFEPEKVDMKNPAVKKVLFFGETMGTLVKHGLLDRALLVDLLWIDGIWSRVGPSALAMRKHAGEARLYENLEALALATGA
ncbi:MAG TPA: hypothetical protein VND70_07085 [Acidimicrobiales bacterium]|nr:hypothetical protein [Acidimicrobiales bacterium]